MVIHKLQVFHYSRSHRGVRGLCIWVSLSLCLSACLPVCLSACLPVCLSACLPVCLSPCLPVCLPACLPACLSACLPVCLSVCLFGRVTQKTIAPIDLDFFTRSIIPLARSSFKIIRIWTRNIYFRILHHCEIGQNMPSKYVMTSNVHYDENIRYDVACAS